MLQQRMKAEVTGADREARKNVAPHVLSGLGTQQKYPSLMR